MFVSGETAEPSSETTTIIEDIVQQQVKEMLSQSTALAHRSGSRSIAIEHLMFLIRHDRAKVSRLKTFLSWKDVRKSAKDSDDKPGADAPEMAPEDVAGPGAGGPLNPADAAAKGMNKHKKAKVRLPWDVTSFYNVAVPEREDDEGDEEDEEMNIATLQRLKNADERTKNMTKLEYVHWSECRQASFTFRKGKRFREWAGFGVVTESKPNDDIVDILGFLTYEIVQTLTEEALKVKQAEDAYVKLHGATSKDGGENGGRKRGRELGGLFDPPEEERTPIQPEHVMEAFRRLQQPDRRAKMLGTRTTMPARRGLRLVS